MRRYVAVIDQSGSMGEPSKKGSSQSRWNYAKESTVALARKCEELGGTLDVYTFNGHYQEYKGAGAKKVEEIFAQQSPVGGTDFVPVLSKVFQEHQAQVSQTNGRPTTVMVITDGQPSDEQNGERALAKLIIDQTQKMEGDAELGIGFIQVGDDPKATTFLKHLDDGLQGKGAKYDIVDTKTVTEVEQIGLEATLLAAVND